MEENNSAERYYFLGFGYDADQNIQMTRGDTFSFGIEMQGLDQSLDAAFFTCRKSYDDDITFQKSIGNGIEEVETGLYSVRIAPEDTKNLEAGHYYYDMKIYVNNDAYTLSKGDLWIQHDSTY